MLRTLFRWYDSNTLLPVTWQWALFENPFVCLERKSTFRTICNDRCQRGWFQNAEVQLLKYHGQYKNGFSKPSGVMCNVFRKNILHESFVFMHHLWKGALMDFILHHLYKECLYTDQLKDKVSFPGAKTAHAIPLPSILNTVPLSLLCRIHMLPDSLVRFRFLMLRAPLRDLDPLCGSLCVVLQKLRPRDPGY